MAGGCPVRTSSTPPRVVIGTPEDGFGYPAGVRDSEVARIWLSRGIHGHAPPFLAGESSTNSKVAARGFSLTDRCLFTDCPDLSDCAPHVGFL
jgi:hypothetical protein